MELPFFYSEEISPDQDHHLLNEETSRHIVQVLRMKEGEELNLTNGKGCVFLTEITDAHKKKAAVRIKNVHFQEQDKKRITIAISPLKNMARFEWFLEKATELGVSHIIPLICKRTEKLHFRHDRLKSILVSAMLQSQQAWLPLFDEPVKYESLTADSRWDQKLIAHCEAGKKKNELITLRPFTNAVILIGPEGDFTPEEISLAEENNYTAVSLGNTRLRTETAGISAAVQLTA